MQRYVIGNLVDHFRFSVPIEFIYKIKFQFCQKITPFPCCSSFSFHRMAVRVNKLYHLWIREWLCRPTKSPQDSVSNYWYFSVLCVQIMASSVWSPRVRFRYLVSWCFFARDLSSGVFFAGNFLIGFPFLRRVFTDIPPAHPSKFTDWV